jgi:lysophospholipase L1-like esterase
MDRDIPYDKHTSSRSENTNTAVIPLPKLEDDSYDWWERHKQVMELKDKINPEIVLIGDSITHFWGGQPEAELIYGTKQAWESVFAQRSVLNLGFGWDRIQNVLWRLENGEMNGLSPKAVIINIGTNNTSETINARSNTPTEMKEGLQAICEIVRSITPYANIILTAIFPREQYPDHPRRKHIADINVQYAELAKEQQLIFIDICSNLLTHDGTLSPDIAFDYCHLTERGYQHWADALRPILEKVFSA